MCLCRWTKNRDKEILEAFNEILTRNIMMEHIIIFLITKRSRKDGNILYLGMKIALWVRIILSMV